MLRPYETQYGRARVDGKGAEARCRPEGPGATLKPKVEPISMFGSRAFSEMTAVGTKPRRFELLLEGVWEGTAMCQRRFPRTTLAHLTTIC